MSGYQVVQLPRGQWMTVDQVQGETPEQVKLHHILTSYGVFEEESARSVVYDTLSNYPEHITALTNTLTEIINKSLVRDNRLLTDALKKAHADFMCNWVDHHDMSIT